MFFFCFCFFVFVFLVFFFVFYEENLYYICFFFGEHAIPSPMDRDYTILCSIILGSFYLYRFDWWFYWVIYYVISCCFCFFFYVGGGRIMSVFYFWQDKQFRMDRTYHHCLWYIRFVDNGILYTFTNCRISCLNLEINVNWTSVKHNSCFQLFVYL